MTTKLEPLRISCTSSDCESGLHCFKATKKLVAAGRQGACRACGAELVDWDRVHGLKLDDASFTFATLQFEMIRHHFWHAPFDDRAVNHAKRKGRNLLHAAAKKRVVSSVGRAAGPYDGRQTPFAGNTIYFAQHAVAACCRTCIEYWHGIERTRDLTDDEIEYFVALINCYLDERLPDLGDTPVHVPARKMAG